MIDPVSIGAGAIAKLAFDKWVKAVAGEVAKASVACAVELVKGLRDRQIHPCLNTESFQIAISPDTSSKTPFHVSAFLQ